MRKMKSRLTIKNLIKQCDNKIEYFCKMSNLQSDEDKRKDYELMLKTVYKIREDAVKKKEQGKTYAWSCHV